MAEGAAEERRLVVIMFTDMVDYASRAQQDEALTLEVLEEHNRLLRSVFAQLGGQEIKNTGDGFMLAFASALSAVRCAIDVQRGILEHNASQPPERRFQVRIGMHLGDVVHRGADLVGDGVNIAARIYPLAAAGGICLSRPVYDQVHNKIDAALAPLGRPELKHIREPLEVYRVVLPWEHPPPAQRVLVAEVLGRPRARHWTAGIVAVALVGVAYGVTRGGHRTVGRAVRASGGSPPGQIVAATDDRRPSIAVRPFDNYSAQKADAYLSGGITDQLSSTLAQVRGLRVVSVPTLPADKPDARSLGQRLNVGNVLTGSVQKAGPQLRITVQLVTTGDGSIVWSDHYDRQVREILAIQSEVAERVTDAMQVRLLATEAKRLRKRPTESTEAYEAYLRGRYLLEANPWAARAQFEKAIHLDPRFAEAYTGLADWYASAADLIAPARGLMEMARKAAAQALALDPDLAEARISLATIRCKYDYDCTGAEEEQRRAITINPDYAMAHHDYGFLLVLRGRFKEALPELKRAEQLAPLSVHFTADVHLPYTYTKQYDLAIAQIRKARDLDPNNSFIEYLLGDVYKMKGDYARGIEHLRKAQSASPFPWHLGSLGDAYARAGRTAEARQVLAELKARSRHSWVSPANIAWIQLGLGDKEGAMHSLEAAYQARSGWLLWLKIDPIYDPLRSDPRFVALIRKVGLAG